MMNEKKLDNSQRDIIQELVETIDSLLNKHVAGRGSEHAFVSFGNYSYLPWEWIRAEQAIEKATRFYGEEIGFPHPKLRVTCTKENNKCPS